MAITVLLLPASIAWLPIPVDAFVSDAYSSCRSTQMCARKMDMRICVCPCAEPCGWAVCSSIWTICRRHHRRTVCHRCDGRECDSVGIVDSVPNNCMMCTCNGWRNVVACACVNTIYFLAICRISRIALAVPLADAWSNGTTDCCDMQTVSHKCDKWNPDRAACEQHSREWLGVPQMQTWNGKDSFHDHQALSISLFLSILVWKSQALTFFHIHRKREHLAPLPAGVWCCVRPMRCCS